MELLCFKTRGVKLHPKLN